jgi:hypothetical protein
MPKRNILLHGLSLTLRNLPAFLWTYAFSLALAFIFSIGLNLQLSTILNHSLAAERLFNGFDLGTIAETFQHLHEGPADNAGAPLGHASIPIYLLIYFLLVPGTLFCYLTKTPARLSTLAHQGLLHFWRFFRITLLTVIVGALILGPLSLLRTRWATHVQEHTVGRSAFLNNLAAFILIFLVATLLRLYFDLVEVYTVQLGLHPLRNGKPDRRVRRTLAPAWRTFRANLGRAWFTFLFLTLLGALAVFLTFRIGMHMLAQPRVWPTFLVAQLGLLAMLFTRFWQRGAETSLALQYPIPAPHPVPFTPPSYPAGATPTPEHPQHIDMIYNPDPLTPIYPPPLSPDDPFAHPEHEHHPEPDPIPDPEPAPPSLDEPDPGVFHHDPGPKKPQ